MQLQPRPKFKFRCTRTFLESLQGHIGSIIVTTDASSDGQKLFLSVLQEIDERIRLNLVNYRTTYKISLSPVQAFALRLLYVAAESGNTWFDNELRKITDHIHQHYS